MEKLKELVWKSVPALRLLLALLFIYAGAAKLFDVTAFAAQLQRFGVGNPGFAAAVAHYLPFFEITCGLALILRRFAIGAITLYVGLLIIFEIGLAHAWTSGVQADCGCFGKLFGGANIQVAFLRNLGLLAVASVVLTRECALFRRGIQ